MNALVNAMRAVLAEARISGERVEAMALDTTGSSVIPVDAGLQPLDDYLSLVPTIAPKARRRRLPNSPTSNIWKRLNGAAASTRMSGDSPSCFTGCATTRRKRGQLASAFEHCDMVAATLCGITDPKRVKRSICAMGHKWMWNPKWDGCHPRPFSPAWTRCSTVSATNSRREYHTSDALAGHLAPAWAEKMGLRAGHSDSCGRLRCPLGCDRAPHAGRVTWSTSSAPRPASSPCSGRPR